MKITCTPDMEEERGIVKAVTFERVHACAIAGTCFTSDARTATADISYVLGPRMAQIGRLAALLEQLRVWAVVEAMAKGPPKKSGRSKRKPPRGRGDRKGGTPCP